MIGNWSNWKRFPEAERGEHVEAPIGPGIYEVRNAAAGDLVAFDAAGNVAHALAALRKQPSGWARLFGGASKTPPSGELEYRTCAIIARRSAADGAGSQWPAPNLLAPQCDAGELRGVHLS